ncbi:MAG TPA: hypothetical protein VMT76_05890 [Puia sp.]|nr:hypothetical protein [Puia sp.]
MKTSFKILSGTMLMVSAILLVVACKKDSSSSNSSTDNNNAANMSANGAAADNAYDDPFYIAMQTGNDNGLASLLQQQKNGTATLGYGITGSYYCATVTLKPTNGSVFPDTVIVDFGNGCTSADSITRSGSITYIFSGKLSAIGTTISATFNNYKVNGYQLQGTYAISNTSPNLFTPQLTTTVTNGNITYPSDTSYSFSGTKTVALASGSLSNISTLVFNITGNYSISSSYGESLSANVTSALERKEICAYIDKGTISFKYTKGNTSVNGTLDYGNGTCDNSALITIGAFTKTIAIP